VEAKNRERLPAGDVPLFVSKHSIWFLRRPGVLAFVALFGFAGSPTGRAAPASTSFPALNVPATGEQHPGKLVWADLFTIDPAATKKFYCELFGWTAEEISGNGRSYTVFSNNGRAVAGLVPRRPGSEKTLSRWIGYVAVPDIKASLALVGKSGGQVRAPGRAFPERGTQAIITDNEDAPIGLLQSSSGDPVESEPKVGEWNWFEVYARNPKTLASFYGAVLAYQVTPDDRTERKDDYLLTSGGIPRGGVAPLPDRPDAKAGWLGVIRVADIEQILAKATSLGAEIIVRPRAAAYGSRFAIISDPTGGTIGLVEYVDNANPATRP
jgi:predicted enzyme related to lactoylglutathione lyase